MQIQDVLSRLNKVKNDKNGWMACCPAHNDINPSLSIKEDNGKILFHCFANCSYFQIVHALGFNEHEQKSSNNKTSKTSQKIVAEYDYFDEAGEMVYQAVRLEPKNFRVRRPDGNGGWVWNLNGIEKVPYHLPELLQARENNQPVIICEGEKDADNIMGKLGLAATTTISGSNSWNNDYTEYFDGLNVIILPDNDSAGLNYAHNIAMSLWGIANSVKLVKLPDLPEKGDVSDWIDRGGTGEDLKVLVEQTEEYNPDDFQDVKETKFESQGMFVIKSANQWLEETKDNPIPKMLFGELWYEGEVCILFADTNAGKSIIAVQIAESITKGNKISPLSMNAEPQKVLYFDFELTDRQFTNRYSEQEYGFYINTYEFSENFFRVQINPDSDFNCSDNFEVALVNDIERTIKETGVKILMIDNITFLSANNEKAKDALPLMKQLQALKRKYDLSLLVLAHTPKRDDTRPLTNNDLHGSKMLMNFADSSFAIGKSQKNTNFRYIKQIKERNTSKIYHDDNVCVFEVNKKENFLSFNFIEYGKELEHLKSKQLNSSEYEARRVQELVAQNINYRDISKMIGISLGKVCKLANLEINQSVAEVIDVQTVHPLFDVNIMNSEEDLGTEK